MHTNDMCPIGIEVELNALKAGNKDAAKHREPAQDHVQVAVVVRHKATHVNKHVPARLKIAPQSYSLFRFGIR